MQFYANPSPDALFDLPSYRYDGRQNTADILRPFAWSGYVWRGLAVPRAVELPVAARVQIERRVQVPAGSYLLAFSGFSDQAAGYKFRIYDIGAQQNALGDIPDDLRSGAQDGSDTDGVLHVLTEPYVIVEPGLLQVTLTNLATAAADMALVLHFAVPLEGLG